MRPPARTSEIRALLRDQVLKHWVAYLTIIFIIIGAALRLHNLDTFGFWVDELFHVLAGQSLTETGKPLLPTGRLYSRALVYTQVTALSLSVFGISEWSARIPSVLFNLLFIIVSFFIVKRLFNKVAALIFVFIMVFSPFEIVTAREARMYALFQFLYFLLSLAFLVGYEGSILSRKKDSRYCWLSRLEAVLDVRMSWLMLATVVFMLSLHIHPLTKIFGSTVLAYCVVRIITNVFSQITHRETFKYIVPCVIAVGGGLVLLVLDPDLVYAWIARATEPLPWAHYRATDGFTFYRWFFADMYTALTFLFPLGAVFVVDRYKEKGIFVVLSFVVPMFFHAFVFGQIEARYIFNIYPFFVLTVSLFLGYAITEVTKILGIALKGQNRLMRGATILSSVIALYALCHPWVGEGFRVTIKSRVSDWKSLVGEVRINDETIITTSPLQVLYYFQKTPDYYFSAAREQKDGNLKEQTIIKGLREFQNILRKHKNVVLFTTDGLLNNEAFIDRQLREYITRNLRLVKHDGDKSVMIFKFCVDEHKTRSNSKKNLPPSAGLVKGQSGTKAILCGSPT